MEETEPLSEPEMEQNIDPTPKQPAGNKKDNIWKIFMSRHWRMFALGVATFIFAIVGAVLVFLWLAGDAQATGLVPRYLGSWAMVHVIDFILHLIFWLLVLIVLPLIIIAATTYKLWYKRLPKKERHAYWKAKLFKSKSKSRDSSSGFSFIFNILFMVKVYIDGNWHEPFSSWSFDYVIDIFLWSIMIILVIIGIPILLGGIWWLARAIRR